MLTLRQIGRRWRSTEVRNGAKVLERSLERHHSIPGLGAATIQGHYDVLGCEVPEPKFLKMPKATSVIGAPMSFGQPHAGTDQGPKLLRENGLISCLQSLGWKVNEKGDLSFQPPNKEDPKSSLPAVKNCFAVGKGLEDIYKSTEESIRNGDFCLVLGGDHSIGLATVAAALKVRPNTGIIWVDAHADLNTPDASSSGNLHGTPLAFLAGLIDTQAADFGAKYPGFEWFQECGVTLDPSQLVYVGLRDLDAFERTMITEKKIKSFTMHHVDRYGIGSVMEQALEHLKDRPLHVSYDIDAVDPEVAPSTGTVVRGGLNFREAHYVVEAVGNTGRLCSMDLVEVNPTLKPGKEAELTCHLGMAVIASAMGSRIL